MTDILDTNVLVRFLVGDHTEHLTAAKKWFAEAQRGKREILVPTLVVAETIFVLESFYKKPRAEIAEAFRVLLSQRWLYIPEREILIGALEFYEDKKHFVDAYLLAACKIDHHNLLTFDKKLKKALLK